jgi:hypothetical protein
MGIELEKLAHTTGIRRKISKEDVLKKLSPEKALVK